MPVTTIFAQRSIEIPSNETVSIVSVLDFVPEPGLYRVRIVNEHLDELFVSVDGNVWAFVPQQSMLEIVVIHHLLSKIEIGGTLATVFIMNGD